jgi:hypothetical protein
MHRPNPRATACLDAVALARDASRLQQAPATDLLRAAAVLAKRLVSAIDSAALEASRAAAVDVLDSAGRAIGDELRRVNRVSN